jgi:iduronate 2-sulfatase
MKNLLLFAFVSCLMCFNAFAQSAKRPNVLFIPIDDFKPLINAYGESHIKTPNIDRLAARGLVFQNAQCQYAICGSSRVSLMTGLYIDSARVFSFSPKMREANPDALTLPQYFRQNGYVTTGIGKTFDSRTVDKQRDALSWSIPYQEYIPPAQEYGHQKGGYRGSEIVRRTAALEQEYAGDYDRLKLELARQGLRPLTEMEDYPDAAYSDGQKAIVAMEALEELSQGDEPFFYSVGFQKPHLPFVAPKKYWDMYDREDINLAYQGRGSDIPEHAFGNIGEIHSYSLREELPFSEEYQKEVIHGYYACVSFIDAQVGLILDKLEELEITDNTIVCLWGDHGWHLGDHGLWCKHTNFEQAVRSPLIIAAPDMNAKGQSSASPVGLIDIFPTLCDLAGLEIPSHLQGVSLRPILDDPAAKVKEVEMAQYPRTVQGKYAMGYTVRSERYRYTAWKTQNYRQGELGGPIVSEELYDYEEDPDETFNLANDAAYEEIMAEHRRNLDVMIAIGQRNID